MTPEVYAEIPIDIDEGCGMDASSTDAHVVGQSFDEAADGCGRASRFDGRPR